MLFVFNSLIYVLFAVLTLGTLLPLSDSPHWFVRNWDYPRVQIVIIACVAAAIYCLINGVFSESAKTGMLAIGLLTVAISAWHLFRILPYTGLAPTQAKPWEPGPIVSDENDSRRLRVLLSNLEMENEEFERWSRVVLTADADVMIVAEIDDRWAATIESMSANYPHQVLHPQDNWYGLAILSRFPIVESKTRFLVEDDVPSIDTTVELPLGDQVRLVAVHPRPPEPLRDNDATARDAELVLWGKELGQDPRPIVIGGDLNDVAWSATTRLFLRLSGLLDPRRGRGFYNSFHADHIWMRFPLDHVFHSTHFSIRDLRRLPHVGSDHFPIFVDLQLNPTQKIQHEPLEEKSTDHSDSEERLERAEEEHGLKAESIDSADKQTQPAR